MAGMNRHNQITILLVEDDDGHAALIKDHFREARLSNPVQRFCDGEEILNFLFAEKEVPLVIQDYLMLLDIRMPKVDGFEVLQKMRTHEALAKLPVIILTTTDEPWEVKKCFQLGCNSYLTKPVEFPNFLQALRKVGLNLDIVRNSNDENNSEVS
ncbi:MAG: response regulator [Pseudomonadota bacterium]